MLQPIRGTKDILPPDSQIFRWIIDTAWSVAHTYNYHEINTPIIESTDVFQRTLGDTSDIVSKEMYTFQDRGGSSITLRPEGTAPIARAVISNKLTQSLPLKFFSSGPMFRYERPQKGRQRQFHQLGVEYIGVSQHHADVEVISLGYEILKSLNLHDQVTLQINSLGDSKTRQLYREALVKYLTPLKNKLSKDSQERLDKNPLRILDSKEGQDQHVLQSAPSLNDYFSEEARLHFENVQQDLEKLGIPFQLNPRLVRGLDYYCHTAFEFVTDSLGAQGALIAGGRYDHLIEQMGGPSIPAVGFGAGIERLMLMVAQKDPHLSSPHLFYVIPASPQAERKCQEVMYALRKSKHCVDMGYSGNLSKRLKKANQQGAYAAIIIGDEELADDTCLVRILTSGTQEKVPSPQIVDYIQQLGY